MNNGIRNLAIFFCILALVFFAQKTVRAYQTNNLIDIFGRYENLARKKILTTDIQLDKIYTLITAKQNDFFSPLSGYNSNNSSYMSVKISSKQCKTALLELSIEYEYSDPYNNYGRKITLQTVTESDYYFPVFKFPNTEFIGIKLKTKDRACISHLAKVVDLSTLKILPYVTLSTDWKEHSLQQRSIHEPFLDSRFTGQILPYPARNTDLYRDPYIYDAIKSKSISVLESTPIKYLHIPGNLYALLSKKIAANSGDQLFIEGRIFKGQVTIGVLRGGSWHFFFITNKKGKFRAIFDLDKADNYQVAIAVTSSNTPYIDLTIDSIFLSHF